MITIPLVFSNQTLLKRPSDIDNDILIQSKRMRLKPTTNSLTNIFNSQKHLPKNGSPLNPDCANYRFRLRTPNRYQLVDKSYKSKNVNPDKLLQIKLKSKYIPEYKYLRNIEKENTKDIHKEFTIDDDKALLQDLLCF